MSLYRNAFYWFCLLLVVLVVGFWRTYFSQLGQGTLHITHHVHGASMLIWVIMLITQSWLIRTRRNPLHRTIGGLSFAVAPAIVISGFWVNFHFLVGMERPLPPPVLSIFWFGFFLSAAFAVLFAMAIVHRKRVQLHARYMVATSLVFLIPGLGRALDNYVAPVTGWVPTFFQLTFLPLLIGGWLLYLDWRRGKHLRPFLLFNAMWVANLLVWVVSPNLAFWRSFASWATGGEG